MSGRVLAGLLSFSLVAQILGAPLAAASYVQQGDKLTATGETGAGFVGLSVAISADGNTAILGGSNDNSGIGAAWVFTRTAGVWSQQAVLLDPSGADQGYSVALSADGSTALVGEPFDSGGRGAVLVWVRTDGVWSQQAKLFGSPSSYAHQGTAVALSADGNTAISGGPGNNNGDGAAWVFTRSAALWNQQAEMFTPGSIGNGTGVAVALSADGNLASVSGAPGQVPFAQPAGVYLWYRTGDQWSPQNFLRGAGAIGDASQGASVGISADGSTIIEGGYKDDSYIGAAWAWGFGTQWAQLGDKLIGAGEVGPGEFGSSAAISGDGNTAIVGGPGDNIYGTGATWVYIRNGDAFSQQGDKLVGTGGAGWPRQGTSVALSSDGSTALIGGYEDNYGVGAAWVFVDSGGVAGVRGDAPTGDLSIRFLNGNPAHGAIQLELVLPNSGDARLDLFDVMGRRVASRDVSVAAPGRQVVQLADRALPPGIYSARLSQGRHEVHERIVLLR